MLTEKLHRDLDNLTPLDARNSLLIAGLAITFGLAIGTFLGMVAGYFRGWVDTVIENVPAWLTVVAVALLCGLLSLYLAAGIGVTVRATR